MYERGAFKELVDQGFDGTWLEWFLKETEMFHAKARRYTSPDEHPFTPNLPLPLLPPLQHPPILYGPATDAVNVNASILSFYSRATVPAITRRATKELASYKRAKGKAGGEEFEDDGNYGSAAIADVAVLQIISKRIHYGKFVSESKFRSDPAAFIPHIETPNPAALEALITKPAVEKALLVRLGKKASIYGPEISTSAPSGGVPNGGTEDDGKWKIDVESVRELYESWIIPLTKEVEVRSIFR
ncbi:chorismate mutase [Clavulina sp. PMI_390]|nr:chorismate mutase [Clavulina sp. PMI_390]